MFPESHSAAVSGRAVGRTNGEKRRISLSASCAELTLPPSHAGPLEKIFMKEDAALNFFRRRSRRAVKSQDELNGEFARRGLGETHSDQVTVIPFNHLVKLQDY